MANDLTAASADTAKATHCSRHSQVSAERLDAFGRVEAVAPQARADGFLAAVSDRIPVGSAEQITDAVDALAIALDTAPANAVTPDLARRHAAARSDTGQPGYGSPCDNVR